MSLSILSFSIFSVSFFCSRSVLVCQVTTALVSFCILPVMERWYSLKSLACCRMLFSPLGKAALTWCFCRRFFSCSSFCCFSSFSVMRASLSVCRLLRRRSALSSTVALVLRSGGSEPGRLSSSWIR
ncbi:hypothetical protein EYF80_049921 [Liparis tanakae]|uniref:Uncharacterized protein n=1 Tax=Liparis tanakae TaxID=230148 RepID=A0A4Z2FF84_9TELE|nr:hypothetical protein EYF80_049921 [Liparis tanakae]